MDQSQECMNAPMYGTGRRANLTSAMNYWCGSKMGSLARSAFTVTPPSTRISVLQLQRRRACCSRRGAKEPAIADRAKRIAHERQDEHLRTCQRPDSGGGSGSGGAQPARLRTGGTGFVTTDVDHLRRHVELCAQVLESRCRVPSRGTTYGDIKTPSHTLGPSSQGDPLRAPGPLTGGWPGWRRMPFPIRAAALAPRSSEDFGSTSNIQQLEHLRGLSESGFSNDVPRNTPTLLEFV